MAAELPAPDAILDDAAPWARRTGDGWSLSIRVQPGAARPGVVGAHGDALKVRVCAPATDGRANAELVRVLGEVLEIAPRCITIAHGHGSRSKVVTIST